MTAERKDVWASGDAYEPYVGRWSRLIARQFVTWLGVPPNKDWLDVGSGTGALCEVILAGATTDDVGGRTLRRRVAQTKAQRKVVAAHLGLAYAPRSWVFSGCRISG